MSAPSEPELFSASEPSYYASEPSYYASEPSYYAWTYDPLNPSPMYTSSYHSYCPESPTYTPNYSPLSGGSNNKRKRIDDENDNLNEEGEKLQESKVKINCVF